MKKARLLILVITLSAMLFPAEARAETMQPRLVETTAYTGENDICYRGDPVREGIVAGKAEWYGLACVIYEAVPDEAGGYKIGNIIEIDEVLDFGYGKSTGDGIPSRARPDKTSRGTIETGETIDRYCETMEGCRQWMKETQGKVFIQLLEARG